MVGFTIIAATLFLLTVGFQRTPILGLDLKGGTVSLNHDAIASLKWPAMTMEFKAANPSLLKDLKPGAPVSFEFVERQAGEWVITSITPTGAKAAAKSHSGH